jgi:hypothetical protein
MCDKKGEVLQKCEEFIRLFNPVTHSIDTHIETQLAKKSKVLFNLKHVVMNKGLHPYTTLWSTNIAHQLIYHY